MTELSRRRILIGGTSVAVLAACSRPTVLADPAEPVPATDKRIEALERRHNAVVGLSAIDLGSGRWLAHRANDGFAMCSTFKGYAAAAVLQKSERGVLALTEAVTIEPTDIVAHAPVTETRVGKTMTLAELCQAALQQSDNTAANLLLRALGGPSAITEFARSIGDVETRLDRWETELNSAAPGDPRDTTTPYAIGVGYRNLLTGDALAPPSRQQLEDWMRANQTSSMRAGLPPGWTTADKTGSGDYGSTNDVGVANGPAGQRLLLSMMTRSADDTADAPGLRPLIGELTTLVVADLLQPK